MPSKLKKLYHKAKKGLKNIVSLKKHTKGQEAKISNDKPKPLSEIVMKPNLCLKVTSKAKKDKKGIKKKLNPIKVKKNKIIGSKRLAFLLTSGTIIAILPTFNLAPFAALAVTSACVFSINFIAVKTLKKFIKQRKLAAESKEVAKPEEEIQDVSIQQVAENSKQISKE